MEELKTSAACILRPQGLGFTPSRIKALVKTAQNAVESLYVYPVGEENRVSTNTVSRTCSPGDYALSAKILNELTPNAGIRAIFERAIQEKNLIESGYQFTVETDSKENQATQKRTRYTKYFLKDNQGQIVCNAADEKTTTLGPIENPVVEKKKTPSSFCGYLTMLINKILSAITSIFSFIQKKLL